MRIAIVVALVAFFLLLLWLAFANGSAEAPLSLGLGEVRQVPVAGIVTMSAIAGALFVAVLALVEGLALRLENRRLRRRLDKLEEETHDLRNLALAEDTRSRELSASEPEESGSVRTAP